MGPTFPNRKEVSQLMDLTNYQFNAIPLNLIDYVKKKSTSAKSYFRYLLMRTIKMFEYHNLPDTIPADMLERYLQINGAAAITEAKGKLYVFNGSAGGCQDVYYRPTKFVIANPHVSQLKPETFSTTATIFGDEPHDAVLLRNDTEWLGLTPLISRYAVLMAENTLTIRTADILLRILALLSAGTDKAKASAEAYLAKLESGELGVIMDPLFTESVKMQSPPSNNGSYLTQFIELQQYLKGSFFNELGLRANYNMKREAIGTGESTLDSDAILPLCDNMLQCRREDISQLNDLYNLSITVDFSSAWADAYIERSATLISQLNACGAVGSSGGELGQVDATGDVDEVDELAEPSKGTSGSINGSTENGENEKGGTEDAERNEGDKESGRDSERSTGDDETDDSEARRDGEENAGAGEGAGEEESEESKRRRQEIKDELESGELTVAEAAVECINDKISQLIEEVREDENSSD